MGGSMWRSRRAPTFFRSLWTIGRPQWETDMEFMRLTIFEFSATLRSQEYNFSMRRHFVRLFLCLGLTTASVYAAPIAQCTPTFSACAIPENVFLLFPFL